MSNALRGALVLLASLFASACAKLEPGGTLGDAGTADGGFAGTTFCTEAAQASALFCADFDGISLVTGWGDTSTFEGIYLTSDSTLSTTNVAHAKIPTTKPDVPSDELADKVTLTNATSVTLAFDLYVSSATTQETTAIEAAIALSDGTTATAPFSVNGHMFMVDDGGVPFASGSWTHVTIVFTPGGGLTPEGELDGVNFKVAFDGTAAFGGIAPGTNAGLSAIAIEAGFCGGLGDADYALDNIVITSP